MLDEFTASNPETDVDLSEDDRLFCATCHGAVTRESLAIECRDAHEHTVFNPMGQVFVIRCFAEAWGIISPRDGHTEFSWFPGFQWRVALCGGCGVQLGWRYDRSTERFYGLIAKELTKSPS